MSTETNKALVRRAAEGFSTGDIATLDEFYAADMVDHNPAPGQAPGLEGLKQSFMMFHSAFPDMSYTLEDIIAEGDKVVTRGTIRGTHKGAFLGIPPTGNQVAVTGIDIWRVADGKPVEVWHNEDQLGMMQQLGVIPAPEQSR
jgi:steroid delta-isomerase-like uncharacterized protein